MLTVVLLGGHLWAASLGSSPTHIFDLPILFQDETGRDVLFNQWRGEKIVIAPAYTSCRFTCPMVVTEQLQRIEKMMDEHQIKGEIVFITLDPETDSNARLAAFRKSHELKSKRWHFLRTTQEETKKLMSFLNYKYEILDGHISHDKKTFVFQPDGSLAETLQGFNADLGKLFER